MSMTLFRRITQGLTLLLIIAVPVMNIKGITAVTGSLYSMAFGPLQITDPLSGFQVLISGMDWDNVLLLSLLIPVLLALFFGRVFCGWVCPQNALSELFDFLSEKLKPRRMFHPPLTAMWRYGLLILLIALVLFLHFPVANLISAPGIISVQITKYIYEGRVGIELGLIGLIVLAEVFLIRRVWCNYVCPVGGFLGVFRFGKTMRVHYKEDADHICGRCSECVLACRLGLDPMAGNLYPLCHNCGDCIAACERIKNEGKPLFFSFGK
jgi:ferredoxin-type protein NapH